MIRQSHNRSPYSMPSKKRMRPTAIACGFWELHGELCGVYAVVYWRTVVPEGVVGLKFDRRRRLRSNVQG